MEGPGDSVIGSWLRGELASANALSVNANTWDECTVTSGVRKRDRRS
jgi:hypothetical protein